jgi:cytochrome c peroxidase
MAEDITENKIQLVLSQFVRSIQSFDAKYDAAGRALVANDNQQFSNFTTQENQGKKLILSPPVFDATGNRTVEEAVWVVIKHLNLVLIPTVEIMA